MPTFSPSDPNITHPQTEMPSGDSVYEVSPSSTDGIIPFMLEELRSGSNADMT